MASGTVGYTDTRGNKDYSSIIANQIGRRLKEASNMASEERAYAAGMAEAGGTSLEEAGIRKGYFFGRALGSRFGGDRIARTKGRMGMGGAGTNPATNYKQRFRGGFDYKVENNVITDTAPLSNAVVTGLRGVQSGLNAVSNSLAAQGREIGKLSNVTADMAKATMLNGYIFQMFASQQRAQTGRASARAEERSIERGTGSFGGRIGGSSFGGAGGGRGMINITPTAGGGGSAGSGGMGGVGGGGALTGLGATDILSAGSSFYLRQNSPFMKSLQSNLAAPMAKGFQRITGRAHSGDVFRAMSASSGVGALTNPVSTSTGLEMVGKNIAKTAGHGEDVGNTLAAIIRKGAKPRGAEAKSTEKMIETILGFERTGLMNTASADTLKMLVSSRGGPHAAFIEEVVEASARSRAYQKSLNPDSYAKMMSGKNAKQMESIDNMIMSVQRDMEVFRSLTDSSGKRLYTDAMVEKFGLMGLSPGEKNVEAYEFLLRRYKKKGLTSMGMRPLMISRGQSIGNMAEDFARLYPGSSFSNVEDMIAYTQFGRLIESGMSEKKALKAVEGMMGSEVANRALIRGAKEGAKNSKMGKLMGKFGNKGALKRLPIIGALAGAVFGAQRMFEGDFKGGLLEIGSGLLGLSPKTTGMGLLIDSYLLSRDLGVVPMKTGGRLSGFPLNSLLSVNGTPVASFNEPLNKESIQIVRDDKDAPIEQGKGIVEGMLKKKNDYAALTGMGVERGLESLGAQGFFTGLLNNAQNIGNNLTNPIKSMKNWFMKGFTPGESSMSWKDLLSNDWMQRQGTKGAGGKGMWNPFRGMPGYGKLTTGGEIPGGFQTGPTPAARQAFLRGFKLLTNPKAFILGSLMTPTALGDGTLTGNMDYLNSLGVDTSNLQGGSSGGAANATVINNTYHNYNGTAGGDNTSGDEVIGQSFNYDLEKFITNFSIMSK